MTLLELQQEFAFRIAQLIFYAYSLGYKITFGENYDDDGIGHMRHSCHYIRLAADLNLFKNGVWLTKSEDHTLLGEYWENLGTQEVPTRWGGRWGDGNHYSIEYGGRK